MKKKNGKIINKNVDFLQNYYKIIKINDRMIWNECQNRCENTLITMTKAKDKLL